MCSLLVYLIWVMLFCYFVWLCLIVICVCCGLFMVDLLFACFVLLFDLTDLF